MSRRVESAAVYNAGRALPAPMQYPRVLSPIDERHASPVADDDSSSSAVDGAAAIGADIHMTPGRADVSVPIHENQVNRVQIAKAYQESNDLLRLAKAQTAAGASEVGNQLIEELEEERATRIANDPNYRWARYVAGHCNMTSIRPLYQPHLQDLVDTPIPDSDDALDLRTTGHLCFTPKVVAARDAAYHALNEVVRCHLGKKRYRQQQAASRTLRKRDCVGWCGLPEPDVMKAFRDGNAFRLQLPKECNVEWDKKEWEKAWEKAWGKATTEQQEAARWTVRKNARDALCWDLYGPTTYEEAPDDIRDRVRARMEHDPFSMHALVLHPETRELFARLTAAKMLHIDQLNPKAYYTVQSRRDLRENEQAIRFALKGWLREVHPKTSEDDEMFARTHPYMQYGLDAFDD